MDIVLQAQIVGAVGFGLLVVATFAKTRTRFLLIDIAGLAPTAIHYVMLNAAAGAALTAFYMASDAVAALAGQRAARAVYWVFYPAAGLVGWIFWAGPSDLLAIGGTILAVAARHQRPVWRIQTLVVASTIGWGAYGFVSGSYVQVIFSSVYGAAALLNAIRFFRARSSLPGSPEAD